MSAWKPKRFWSTSAIVSVDGGWTVQLDGRPVKTPAKTLLVVPTEALAQAIAAEWDAQQGEIKPDTIAFFRKDWKGVCTVHETVKKVYMIR